MTLHVTLEPNGPLQFHYIPSVQMITIQFRTQLRYSKGPLENHCSRQSYTKQIIGVMAQKRTQNLFNKSPIVMLEDTTQK